MKVIITIMLVALIIGITPACAVATSAGLQTADPMAVKGKGVEAEAASELTEQSQTEQNTTTNNETLNTTTEATNPTNTGTSTTTTDSSTITTESSATTSIETSPITETGQIMENIETTDNQTTSDIIPDLNTTGIVMQTTNYTCGPAALATVLNNMGINATEQELANLAGTDENGTTMYGLSEAVKAKGLNAIGMKLSIDDLKPKNIVFITANGEPHYSVVREVTNESVKLADPSLGNIEMSKEKFAEVYSGNALVITDPNNPTQVNGTTNQTNNLTNLTSENTNSSESVNNETDANSTSAQSENRTLTKEEMQSIKGKRLGGHIYTVWVYGQYWTWWHWRYCKWWAYCGRGKNGGFVFAEFKAWQLQCWWGKETAWHEVQVRCVGGPPWNWNRRFTPPHPYGNPYY